MRGLKEKVYASVNLERALIDCGNHEILVEEYRIDRKSRSQELGQSETLGEEIVCQSSIN